MNLSVEVEELARGGLKVRTVPRGPLRRNKVYRTWHRIISRCHNENDKSYPYYGGRGIHVCPEWRASFEAFYAAVGDPPTKKYTLERKKNHLGYEPGNVVWATWKEQAQNRRSNVRLALGDEEMTMAQWADRLGCDRRVIWKRLRLGWPLSRALTTAVARADAPERRAA